MRKKKESREIPLKEAAPLNNNTPSGLRFDFAVCLVLTLIILSTYWQVIDHQFVYDDVLYITENPQVQKGLTLENIFWSLSAEVASNWHPLTLLSHMIDCQLYGLNPAGHHVTSLLFHIVNSLILFLLFKKMTKTVWQSALVAALFAIHPLHVESVAWVAERKDVLSTFFMLLTMWSYARYVQSPGFKRYLPVLLFLILGLMAKPMLVTLPFVLLLLDYWPLKRFEFGRPGIWQLVLEKIPLFIIVAASCIITLYFQKVGGALVSLDNCPLYVRLTNVLLSYSNYFIKMVWPFKLAAFYPHPKVIHMWQMIGAGLFILFMTYFALNFIKQHSYIAVGWFWYLGTLVPVIGLIQVGSQSMADRYTYVPFIGIFITIAWGVPELFSRWPYKKISLAITSAILLSILTIATFKQVQYWKNSYELFNHAIQVTTENYFAHDSLGVAFAEQGKLDDAIFHFSEALRITPQYALSHSNMGAALERQGKLTEAIRHYSEAFRINPEYLTARNNLGAALLKQKKLIEAFKTHPELLETHLSQGAVLSAQGKIEEAIMHINLALELKPKSAKAHFLLGNILLAEGKTNEAIIHFQETLRIDNNLAEAHMNLGYALHTQGKEEEAVKHCLEAIRLNPDTSIDAYYNLACIYAMSNKTEEAVDWLKKAVDQGFDNWDLLRSDKDLENIRNTPHFNVILNQINESATKP